MTKTKLKIIADGGIIAAGKKHNKGDIIDASPALATALLRFKQAEKVTEEKSPPAPPADPEEGKGGKKK
jgi:hypothetical protein